MKSSVIISFAIAMVIAIVAVCFFVHPVLVLTLKDIFMLICVDAILAFLFALYLSDESKKNSLMMWTIIGAICLPISIVASAIKYNKKK